MSEQTQPEDSSLMSKRIGFKFMIIFFCVLIISTFKNSTVSFGQGWNQIEKVTFYGYKNPTSIDSLIVGESLDVEVMTKYFRSAKACGGRLSKGTSIYLTVEFNKGEKVAIQFIAGGYDIFHVIKSDNSYLEDWYRLDPKHKGERQKLLKSLVN